MKKVFGMATMPERLNSLQRVLNSIVKNVDYGFVVFNCFDEIPHFMEDYPNVRSILFPEGVDLKAAAKFYPMTILKEDCYYFTCDDDILYTPNYFDYMAKKCRELNSVVVQYGLRLSATKAVNNLRFFTNSSGTWYLSQRFKDIKVPFGGTGVMCIDTKQFKIKNMNQFNTCFKKYIGIDVWMSLELFKKGISITCVKSDENDKLLKKIQKEKSISSFLYEERKTKESIEINNLMLKEINKVFFNIL